MSMLYFSTRTATDLLGDDLDSTTAENVVVCTKESIPDKKCVAFDTSVFRPNNYLQDGLLDYIIVVRGTNSTDKLSVFAECSHESEAIWTVLDEEDLVSVPIFTSDGKFIAEVVGSTSVYPKVTINPDILSDNYNNFSSDFYKEQYAMIQNKKKLYDNIMKMIMSYIKLVCIGGKQPE